MQTCHKSTQLAQHVRLIGEKDEMICPEQLNYKRTRQAALKALLVPIDIAQIGGVYLLDSVTLLSVLGLIPMPRINSGTGNCEKCKHGHMDF